MASSLYPRFAKPTCGVTVVVLLDATGYTFCHLLLKCYGPTIVVFCLGTCLDTCGVYAELRDRGLPRYAQNTAERAVAEGGGTFS